jgi:hypothetical protein
MANQPGVSVSGPAALLGEKHAGTNDTPSTADDYRRCSYAYFQGNYVMPADELDTLQDRLESLKDKRAKWKEL